MNDSPSCGCDEGPPLRLSRSFPFCVQLREKPLGGGWALLSVELRLRNDALRSLSPELSTADELPPEPPDELGSTSLPRARERLPIPSALNERVELEGAICCSVASAPCSLTAIDDASDTTDDANVLVLARAAVLPSWPYGLLLLVLSCPAALSQSPVSNLGISMSHVDELGLSSADACDASEVDEAEAVSACCRSEDDFEPAPAPVGVAKFLCESRSDGVVGVRSLEKSLPNVDEDDDDGVDGAATAAIAVEADGPGRGLGSYLCGARHWSALLCPSPSCTT